ncbi:hypothetical protein DFJ74DRAFT_676475 [Hyaloraphidium curvatum]|nr:hypothetical protein DFJ74DRAFT_676475 [Hyaloraphidium curvatum]
MTKGKTMTCNGRITSQTQIIHRRTFFRNTGSSGQTAHGKRQSFEKSVSRNPQYSGGNRVNWLLDAAPSRLGLPAEVGDRHAASVRLVLGTASKCSGGPVTVTDDATATMFGRVSDPMVSSATGILAPCDRKGRRDAVARLATGPWTCCAARNASKFSTGRRRKLMSVGGLCAAASAYEGSSPAAGGSMSNGESTASRGSGPAIAGGGGAGAPSSDSGSDPSAKDSSSAVCRVWRATSSAGDAKDEYDGGGLCPISSPVPSGLVTGDTGTGTAVIDCETSGRSGPAPPPLPGVMSISA